VEYFNFNGNNRVVKIGKAKEALNPVTLTIRLCNLIGSSEIFTLSEE
jgi:hypothetical protein